MLDGKITMDVSLTMVTVISLQARMESLKARIAAMESANREMRTNYSASDFFMAETELLKIAGALETIAGEIKDRQDQERMAQADEKS
jgi:hypothetical protein